MEAEYALEAAEYAQEGDHYFRDPVSGNYHCLRCKTGPEAGYTTKFNFNFHLAREKLPLLKPGKSGRPKIYHDRPYDAEKSKRNNLRMMANPARRVKHAEAKARRLHKLAAIKQYEEATKDLGPPPPFIPKPVLANVLELELEKAVGVLRWGEGELNKEAVNDLGGRNNAAYMRDLLKKFKPDKELSAVIRELRIAWAVRGWKDHKDRRAQALQSVVQYHNQEGRRWRWEQSKDDFVSRYVSTAMAKWRLNEGKREKLNKEGARAYARKHGLPIADTDSLVELTYDEAPDGGSGGEDGQGAAGDVCIMTQVEPFATRSPYVFPPLQMAPPQSLPPPLQIPGAAGCEDIPMADAIADPLFAHLRATTPSQGPYALQVDKAHAPSVNVRPSPGTVENGRIQVEPFAIRSPYALPRRPPFPCPPPQTCPPVVQGVARGEDVAMADNVVCPLSAHLPAPTPSQDPYASQIDNLHAPSVHNVLSPATYRPLGTHPPAPGPSQHPYAPQVESLQARSVDNIPSATVCPQFPHFPVLTPSHNPCVSQVDNLHAPVNNMPCPAILRPLFPHPLAPTHSQDRFASWVDNLHAPVDAMPSPAIIAPQNAHLPAPIPSHGPCPSQVDNLHAPVDSSPSPAEENGRIQEEPLVAMSPSCLPASPHPQSLSHRLEVPGVDLDRADAMVHVSAGLDANLPDPTTSQDPCASQVNRSPATVDLKVSPSTEENGRMEMGGPHTLQQEVK